MKQGDYTALAKKYKNRPGYSQDILNALARYTGAHEEGFRVADVGAGTGKLTELLLKMGLRCVAVEPNDEMRAEGIQTTAEFNIEWLKGSAEDTGLETSSQNWILMASSFHWTDQQRALAEFHRVLKPGGYFTCLWNPRDIESSDFHRNIEKIIYDIVPELNRISSGGAKYTQTLYEDLITTEHFKNVVFMEAKHQVVMSKDRYMGAWKSVSDVQAQAGPERWEEILRMIEEKVALRDEIVVPYKTRSWTVQRID